MSAPYLVSSPHRRRFPLMLPALGLLLLPWGLAAMDQDPLRLGSDLANPARHADHAHLHGLQPSDAGIEIIALATIKGLDQDADALCQVARLALIAGLVSTDEKESRAWFQRGEAYARTARRLRPRDPDPMFALAAAIGLEASHQPIRERIRSAGQVLDLTDSILELDPDHPGGLHLRGQLMVRAMGLNPLVRPLVNRIIGGDVVAQASWKKAESDFRRAQAREPNNPAHRLELARLLVRTGRLPEAKAELRRATAIPPGDAVTEYYRGRARQLLADLR